MLTASVLAVFGVLALLSAWHCYKKPATLESRLSAIGLLIVGVSFLNAAPLIEPWATARTAEAEARAAQIQLDARVNEIKALSEQLGGPQGYIEYLKARRE